MTMTTMTMTSLTMMTTTMMDDAYHDHDDNVVDGDNDDDDVDHANGGNVHYEDYYFRGKRRN